MSCSEPINIVRGNLVNIPVTLRLDVLSFSFTCGGIVVVPIVGDIYTQTVDSLINGQTTTTDGKTVTVSGGLITSIV